ncbi:hypothetical protein FEM48_Zijuj05G0058100 [Ziziphus jujuba var. spinosa]|uniref:Uncharacterized protein n=1 Tax=Ziziphus jujuba var. spinosa TaxID=714518 RepID=A0A978VD61_ZIZJJ|nr:hypothetical protein FEM48_Zijuj05G0058100 [Ziziphus jujuba var. spinosa]
MLDIRNAAVWSTLGMTLLKTGHLERAVMVLSSLLAVAPDNYDCLGHLGTTHLQSCRGKSAGDAASVDQVSAINVAEECLLSSLKSDSKAASTWANLANACSISGDHRSSSKCLEKVLMVLHVI